MPTPTPYTERARPLLIVVSDSPGLDAELRSRNRDVRYWQEHATVAADSAVFGGDPTASSCYEWMRSAETVSAVIDLHPVARARAALEALRRVRPDAAVLMLSAEFADVPGDGTLARAGRLRDVLRLDLEEELERLEAERRAYCLKQFAAGTDVVPILIHPDPDPDAVSSAFGIATLLGGNLERTPIVTLEEMTRPENRRMVELLRIRVTQVTQEELRCFDRIITVDMQPTGLQQDGKPRIAVIDHHPIDRNCQAQFFDVRPEYGAAATIVTEYLRAVDAKRVHQGLATALLFGIKTDTDSLTRGVSPPDVAAYAFLQQLADLQLVRRFERPSYALATARAFGAALAHVECDDDLCVAYVGQLAAAQAHLLTDLADFCLGIENVTWVVVAGVLDHELVLTLRHAGGGAGAGAIARALAQHGGNGGGHAAMARVTLPLQQAQRLLAAEETARAIRRLVRAAINGLTAEAATSRRDSRPAHPV